MILTTRKVDPAYLLGPVVHHLTLHLILWDITEKEMAEKKRLLH